MIVKSFLSNSQHTGSLAGKMLEKPSMEEMIGQGSSDRVKEFLEKEIGNDQDGMLERTRMKHAASGTGNQRMDINRPFEIKTEEHDAQDNGGRIEVERIQGEGRDHKKDKAYQPRKTTL